MNLQRALHDFVVVLSEHFAELLRVVVVVITAITLLHFWVGFKVTEEECLEVVAENWYADLEHVPTLAERDYIEELVAEACQGMKRDGIIR